MVQASRPEATSAQCSCVLDLDQRLLQRLVCRRAVAAIGPAAGLEQLGCAFDDDGGGALDDGVDAALRQLAVAAGMGEARAELALAGLARTRAIGSARLDRRCGSSGSPHSLHEPS